jgi:hypothetical protein
VTGPADSVSSQLREQVDPDHVVAKQAALRQEGAGSLWGIGPAAGRLVLFGRPSKFEGRRVVSFSRAPTTSVPFPYNFDQRDVDFDRTDSYRSVPLVDLDPRELEASQHGIQSGALSFYLAGSYDVSGELFDKSRNASNDWPIVFADEDSGIRVILQGHHRTTAALLVGCHVRARLIRGWFRRSEGVLDSRPVGKSGTQMIAVTPRLWVGGCHFDHVAVDDADSATVALGSGLTVVVPALEVAQLILDKMNVPEATANYRVQRAHQRIASGVSD